MSTGTKKPKILNALNIESGYIRPAGKKIIKFKGCKRYIDATIQRTFFIRIRTLVVSIVNGDLSKFAYKLFFALKNSCFCRFTKNANFLFS
jgi:hypothetical protein